MKRVPHLDYLRGLAALAVMLFHFQKWEAGYWDATTFLGKCGVYAVSVFFVLSGLTLTLVYERSLAAPSSRAWFSFWRKRVFRIFPLLWLATFATVVLDETPYSAGKILLNLSGLFGFVDPAADIALGAWSIGDELTYYAAFPLLLWLGLRYRAAFVLLLAAAAGLGGVYAFYWLTPARPLTGQWPAYVEPLNHAFFFLSGMAIGLWRNGWQHFSPAFFKKGLVLCLLLFVLFPAAAEPAGLVVGQGRVVLSVLAIGFTAFWYLAKPDFTLWPNRILQWLGEVSYSLYLLHPLVHRCLKALNARYWDASQTWLFIEALAVTLVASHVCYRFLEKPVMGLFTKKV